MKKSEVIRLKEMLGDYLFWNVDKEVLNMYLWVDEKDLDRNLEKLEDDYDRLCSNKSTEEIERMKDEALENCATRLLNL